MSIKRIYKPGVDTEAIRKMPLGTVPNGDDISAQLAAAGFFNAN